MVKAVVNDVDKHTVTSRTSSGKRKTSRSYTYRISYEYEGKSYSSSFRYKSNRSVFNERDKIDIYIDPEDPETVFIERVNNVSGGMSSVGLGVLVLVIGIFCKKKDSF